MGFRRFKCFWRASMSAAIVSVAAACGGDPPTEPTSRDGSISFAYAGAETGTFAVTGQWEPAVGRPTSEGAGATRFRDPSDFLIIAGLRVRGQAREDFIYIGLPNLAAPRTVLLEECLTAPSAACPFVLFGLDVPVVPAAALTEPPQGAYFLTSGTVRVTSVSATRIAGTFEGTAATLELNGTPRVAALTNGRFDVPIFSAPGN